MTPTNNSIKAKICATSFGEALELVRARIPKVFKSKRNARVATINGLDQMSYAELLKLQERVGTAIAD